MSERMILSLILLFPMAFTAVAQSLSFDRTDIATGTGPQKVVVADFNRDSKPDMVVANSGEGSISVLLGNGDGTFRVPIKTMVSVVPKVMAVGDLNGDGIPDVVTNDAVNASLYILLGKGDGTFHAPGVITNVAAEGLAIGDLNGDGKADLAVANNDNNVWIYLGHGDGTFSAPSTVSTGSGVSPQEIIACDLNRDGKLDLVTANANSDNISVLIGNGDGTFKPAVNYPLEAVSHPQAVAVGDVNGDGVPDVIVGETFLFAVAVLLGNGDGTLTNHGYFSVNEYIYDVAIGDVNGDGRPDLVAATNYGTTTTSFATTLLGDGSGNFSAPQDWAVGSSPLSVAVADFNRDGMLDIVTAGSGSAGVTVLLNNLLITHALSANPATGSGFSQAFTFTFSDSAGWQNLGVLDVLINSAIDGRQACYFALVPSGPASGSIYLVDDPGDAGGPFAGNFALPGSGSASNSQCTVSASGSSISTSGNDLTLTLSIAFAPSFAGNRVFFLAARDIGTGNSGWQALGTWNVAGSPPSGPWVSGMSPARSTSATQSYTFTFTDPQGWQDLAVLDVLINSAIDGRNNCYFAYVPTGATTGWVYLVDNAGDSGGPFAGSFAVPGNGSAQNTQCTINGAGASATANGNTLTLTVPITFNSIFFAGNQVFFLGARSNTASSGWQAVGTVMLR